MTQDKKPEGAIRRTPHAMYKLFKRLPWFVCKHCGLVNLQNEATKKALRQGCWIYEDEE
jgi:hypothetical protein